jgi:hypothetical protein
MSQAPDSGAFLLTRIDVFEKDLRKNEVEYRLKCTFFENDSLCFWFYISVNQRFVFCVGLF